MKNIIEPMDYIVIFEFETDPVVFNDIRLHQIGKRFCKENSIISSHIHIDWFELTIVLGGKAEIYANGESVPVSSGDIFLSFPCDAHKIVSSVDEPLKYSFFSFCLEENNPYKEEFQKITSDFSECKNRVFRDNNVIASLVDLLISEMTANAFQKEKLIESTLSQILILIIREFLYKKPANIPNHATNNEILCYRIMRYIDNNIFHLKNLTEIATVFNYNYSYLTKIFRQTTNLTITQYHLNKKLETSKVLIREGKLSFTKIAELLQFASIYSFSKSFKLHFGLSPTEYKNKHLSNHTDNQYLFDAPRV